MLCIAAFCCAVEPEGALQLQHETGLVGLALQHRLAFPCWLVVPVSCRLVLQCMYVKHLLLGCLVTTELDGCPILGRHQSSWRSGTCLHVELGASALQYALSKAKTACVAWQSMCK